MNTAIYIKEVSNGYLVEIERGVNPLSAIAVSFDEVRTIINEEVFSVRVVGKP